MHSKLRRAADPERWNWLRVHNAECYVIAMRLDPTSTFGTLIEGVSNRRAIAVARSALDASPDRPRIVVLLGRSGAGKTHLLHAIANEYLRRHRVARLELWTAETFMNAYVHAIRTARIPEFRRAFVDCEGLFIDGLEDLVGMVSTTMELHAAIRSVAARGRIVVVCGAVVARPLLARICRDRRLCASVVLSSPTIGQRVRALRRIRSRRQLDAAALNQIARASRTIVEARSAAARLALESQVSGRETPLAPC